MIRPLVFCLLLSSCASMLPAVTQGLQWVSAIVDAAETGSDIYFARHPSQNDEARVREALHLARLAVMAGNAKDANAAYESLYKLLDELGVMRAKPPMGGAETESPEPKSFQLPEPAAVAQSLSGE